MVPPWDLGLVLVALTEGPYEPLETASLEALSFKTAFLIMVISSRRVSEIQALSADKYFLTLYPQSAVLRVNLRSFPRP